MEFDKPTTTSTLNGVSDGAASKNATVVRGRMLCAAILLRPTRRLSALQLTLAVISLSMVLWMAASVFFWQFPFRTGSSDQQLLATANLRFEGTKLCEEMDEGHVEKEFYHPESCFSRSDILQIILGLMWTLADVLKTNDILYWLDSGTLLGSVREKTVIPYDVDADIGITEASFFQLRDNQFEFPSEYELQVLGGKFHRSGTRDANLPARFIHRGSGLYVDIFVFLDNKSDPAMFGPCRRSGSPTATGARTSADACGSSRSRATGCTRCSRVRLASATCRVPPSSSCTWTTCTAPSS